jgi:hypothetical protein
MGTYLNPGNSGFQRIVNGAYVDKTRMIALLNKAVDTTKNLVCVSRPRRFGKSFAAQMLCAYYDKTCDSSKLFAKYDIAGDPTYEEHLNRYNVIYLDMASIKPLTQNYRDLVAFITRQLSREIEEACPDVKVGEDFSSTLIDVVERTGSKFVMVLDEWDAPIRENLAIQKEYLDFLRMLFKSSGTTARIFAAAYMTGILPIKKDGSQSAVSDFQEYSMIDPRDFAEYVGFTEDEVRRECAMAGRSFESMKRWYDGYTVGDRGSMYNPYSVMQALATGQYRSYWKKTSAAETLMTYIDMDQDGLQDDVARLIAGESIVVDTDTFQNDVETFTCKDDVLALLIHLGYLTYEEVRDSYDDDDGTLTGLARIPNEEVRAEFRKILRRATHKGLVALVRRSDDLLKDTLAGNHEAVARAIQEVHDSEYAPTFYNNEQSLRYVVKMTYLSCVDQYAKVEELPSGHGIADVVFLPSRRSPLPAMVVELKWNESASGAIAQIKEKGYHTALRSFCGEIVLVGVSYDRKTKRHTCQIDFLGPE